MASFQVVGFISNISYQQGFALVFVSEFKKGFRRKDGTYTDDKYLTWKCIFRQGLVKYVSDHFANGMLVEVKGEILPYAIEHDNVIDGGYTVLAQTLNMSSYPRASAKREISMMKESQASSDEVPNVEEYNQPDF